MALEIFSFLASLVKTNPTPGDPKSAGDDHVRGIKTALVKSFAGFPGAVLVSGVDTGASNAYVLTPSEPLTEYSTRMLVSFIPVNTNGGASTLNISGLGAQAIKRQDGAATSNGDIMAGFPIVLTYTGSEFRMVGVTKQYIDQLVFSGVLPGQTGNGGKPLITNGTTATFSNAFGVAMDEAKGADVASAATLNLSSGAGTGNLVHVTGATTINAITLPSGAERTLVFDGALTLTNSANLILPGGANITTATGDTAIVRGDGTAVRVIDYQRGSGRALVEPTPPGWVLLANVTPAAGVSAIDFLNTFSSTYDDYEVIIDGLTLQTSVTSGGYSLSVQYAVGGVVDSTGSYLWGQTNADPAATTTNNYFPTGATITSDGSGVIGRVFVRMSIQNANALYQGFSATAFSYARLAGSNSYASAIAGMRVNATGSVISGIRILLTAGTLAATGSVKIYGIRKV